MYHEDGSQLTWIIKIPSSPTLASFGDSTITCALPKWRKLYVLPLSDASFSSSWASKQLRTPYLMTHM